MKLSPQSVLQIIDEEEKALGREILSEHDCSERLKGHMADTYSDGSIGHMILSTQGWTGFKTYLRAF